MMALHEHSSKERQAGTWIYSPWLDLIVGCGAWSVPLLLLSYSSMASSTRAWSIVFYALALFFNYPHYMATIYRAYHRAEDFQKYRIFTVHTTALLVLTLILSHSWARILPWIFTIYLVWSPWHYSGQNYGLLMMFARRAGAQPNEWTRKALYGAFVVSYLILFLSFHTGPSTDPLFISLGIPAIVSRWEQVALGSVFLALAGFGLSRLVAEIGLRKMVPSLTLFCSQCLWFLLPPAMSLIKGFQIPQTRYSSGVLAVMHSAQYLWITSYYAKREVRGTGQNWRPWTYFSILVAGGISLFVPGPWLVSHVFHRDFTASFLIFTALVNIHHFILDGAIWKLRDGRIAALLLNSRDRVSDAMVTAGGRLSTTWRWLSGGSSSAYGFRIALAGLLLAWGTVDQVRYYYSLHTDDLQDLRRAASLAAYDSSVQTRIARREMEEGDAKNAEVAWKKAIQANPADSAPRHGLLKLLIDANRFDEALELTNASLNYNHNDASLLVDRGLLLVRLGKSDAAIADWNKALSIDSRRLTVHLYLAYEFDRTGRNEDAIAHYGAYLEGVAHQQGEMRPAPDKLIAVVLRLADCQVRASRSEQALKSYQFAGKLALQTRETKLESLAEVNQAALQAKAGKLDEALQLYQHVLSLDDAIGDTSAAVHDWAAYGQFLREAGFPRRLAYACFLKSESLAKTSQDAPVPDGAEAVRKTLESSLGAEATMVRRDLPAATQQALALRR